MKRLERAFPLLLFGGVFLLYLVGLHGVFIYDDYDQIVNNIGIHDLRNLSDVVFCGLNQLRLVANLSFAWDWFIADGDTWSFHLTNILLHLINGGLLLAYLTRILPRARFTVLSATALFLSHPLGVQAITYIAARAVLLQCTVVLAGLNLYARGEVRYRWWLRGLLVASMLVKETCLVLPALLLLHGLCFEERPFKWVLRKQHLVYLAAPLSFAVFYYILRDPKPMYARAASFDLYPTLEHLAAQGYYHLYHLFLFLNPSLQSLTHEYPGTSVRTVVLGPVGWLCYFAAAAFAVRHRRMNPVASFFIFFYLVTLLPTNTILQLPEPFAEYRLYQAHLSLCIFLALALDWAVGRLKSKAARIGLVTGLVTYLLVFNVTQQWLWLDSFELVAHAIARYPESATLQDYQAWQFEQLGALTEAAAAYEKADIKRAAAGTTPTLRSQFNRARILARQNRLKEARDVLDKMPIEELARGRTPLPYFLLYLEILQRLKLHKDFNDLRIQALQSYAPELLPHWTK